MAKAHCILDLQHLLPLVHQQNAEHLVIDEPPQELPDALQQRIEIENRGYLAGYFVEHRQRLRLPGHAGVEACILDRLGYAGGGQLQQMHVFRLEIADLLGLKVDHANDAVLHDERHGQFRADIGIGADVVRIAPHILQQDGFAVLGGPPNDSLAYPDLQALGFRRMADLKAHTQVVGPFVEQQDGEDSVVDYGAHQVRSAMQQGLQIEGGIQGVRQPYQKFGLQRIDPDRAGQRESF